MLIGKIFPVFVEFLPIKGTTLFMERLRRCTWKIKEDICVVAKFLKIPSILPYVVLCEIFFVTHCTIISWEMCDRALMTKFLTLNYSVAMGNFPCYVQYCRLQLCELCWQWHSKANKKPLETAPVAHDNNTSWMLNLLHLSQLIIVVMYWSIEW